MIEQLKNRPSVYLIVSLFAALTVFYYPYLTGNASFYEGDAAGFFEPFLRFFKLSLTTADSPCWNPYAGVGMAQIALASPNIFYPLNWLFLLFPFTFGLALSMVIHQVLAGLGSYLFIRELGWKKEAGIVCGTAAALNGYMFSLSINYTLVATASWIPWCLWTLLKVLQGKSRYFGALAISVFAIITAGRPEVFAPTLLLLGLAIVASFVIKAPEFKPARTWKQALLAGLAITSGILLSGPVIAPSLEWINLSVRGAGLAEGELLLWSSTWYDFLCLFMIQPLGDSFSYDSRFASLLAPYPGHLPLMGSAFIGASILALAVPAFFDRKWAWRFPVLALLLIFCFLAAGKNSPFLPFLLNIIPALKTVRYPIKLLCFVDFAIAVAAARTINQWSTKTDWSPTQKFSAITLAAGSLLIFSALLFIPKLQESLTPYLVRYVDSDTALAAVQSIAKAGFMSAILILTTYLTVFSRRSKFELLFLLLMLQITVPYFVCAQLNKHLGPAELYESPSFAAEQMNRFAAQTGCEKSLIPLSSFPLTLPQSYLNAPGDMMSKLSLYERQLLEKNIYMDYGYRALTSYAGADTLDMRILSDSAYKECSLFQNSKNPNDELMSTFCRLSGTAFAISQMETNAKVPILDPRFFKVLVEQPLLNIRIYAVNNPVAHAYFMSNWEWRNDRLQIIKEIVNSSKSKFDPAKTALVHRTLSTPESEIVYPEKTELAKQASTKEIEIESIKNDKLRYRIDAEHDGLVVLCDAFYPGWKAFVDGKDHRIFRVNAICRGVFVKSGKHSLEFRYEPDSLKFGFLAALAGLIICIANWLICIRKSAETQEESKIID